MHVLHHFVEAEFKILLVFFGRKGASASCSNQIDLNAPDVEITTCQLLNTNFPGGLERTIKLKMIM